MMDAQQIADWVSRIKQVTPAEAELLTKLFEENSEVIHVVAKTLLYGLDEVNILEPEGMSNIERVEKELGHVVCFMNLLDAAGVIDLRRVQDHAAEKRRTVGRWLVHNQVDKEGNLCPPAPK